MGLLEKLLQEKPHIRVYPGVRNPRLLGLVRKYFKEITEAKKLGYTWKQITQKALELWQENGDFANYVHNYYYRVKREQQEGGM